MKVRGVVSLQYGADDPKSAWSALDQILATMIREINALDVGDPPDDGSFALCENLDAGLLSYTTNSVANTDDVKRHNLGRAPVGMIQIELPMRTGETPNAGVIYWGTGPSSTSSQVTLRCTVASKRACVLIY